ncbi:MAG: flagellar basal body L-ring protein FlgH [Phycisphaerales bacterium]
MRRAILTILGVCMLASSAGAQSLYQRPVNAPLDETGAPDEQADLRAKSMFFYEPPEPRKYLKHDIITIIVDESSKQESSQSLDTKRKYEDSASINALVDPIQLLELRLRQGGLTSQDLLDISADRKYKGEGDYEREDRFSARISARVIEVKPNGTLLLEAKTFIKTDEEEQTLVLSGLARPEDVTNQNTIRSSQLANLAVIRQNEGQVADSAKKGIITKVLDALFAF